MLLTADNRGFYGLVVDFLSPDSLNDPIAVSNGYVLSFFRGVRPNDKTLCAIG